MADVNSNGVGKALAVIDVSTKKHIVIPLKQQEEILAPIVNFRTWIKSIMRTKGIAKANILPGDKVKYYAFPKDQAKWRELGIKVDDQTGEISGGIFGTPDGDGTFGAIRKTMGNKLVSAEVEMTAAKYINHRLMNKDIEESGLAKLIVMHMTDANEQLEEELLISFKAALVASMGTMGTWATAAGHTLPTTGVGARIQSKDYATTAAGGLEIIADIKACAEYRDTIGLKDGNEKDYPFARGTNTSSSGKLIISGDANDAILLAVSESGNGFLPGVGIDKEAGVVKYITYRGKKIEIAHIVNDMPQKGGKDFNWTIIETGKHGSFAIPSVWRKQAEVAKEGLVAKTLEMIGLVIGFESLQPELTFASFKAT